MEIPNKEYASFKVILVIVIFIFLNFSFSYSQNDSIADHDFTRQLWFELKPSWKLSERTRLNTDISYRTNEPKNGERFVSKAEIQYQLKQLNLKNLKFNHAVTGGIGYFYINNFNAVNAFEYRIYQGYSLGFNFTKRTKFNQYLRLEERFTNLFREENSSFGLRLRYKISGIINLSDLFADKSKGFYIPADVEFFFNIKKSKQINDVIRITPGIGYVFNPSFKAQFSIGYHYTKQEFENLVRTNDIIFQLRVYKTFPLRLVKDPHEL
ncbi:Protein of unknown function (DUF2490) [Galbibacter orientalis DSM 19592]|uniref:Outer membrane protein beta-barrel domain-containing protein n=1 Tax=Galbibacter orientalis DSM 19592 TaxID=926559 RepID=I3C922_9FLAO|nr:DUF2490 domain-containing protein [Galbibacter orientalis]EIJ40115.1 Protein of unknown function (DUF2490) [Galbibacter orientalis DSM 19592]